MNRRHFLEAAACAALSGSSFAADKPRQEQLRDYTAPRTGAGPFLRTREGRQPHIFMISADMVSPDLYHPARPTSKHVRTPSIHSLMKDGTFFANACCTVPLCSPSRASYLTGRYSYIQGNGERAPEGLETQLRADDTIYPEYLRAAGYIARQNGKAHVGTGKFIDAFTENDNPWDRWSPPVFDDDAFLTYQRELGVKPQKYSREIVFQMQDRKTPGNSVGGWIVQEDGKPFPFEAHYTYFLAKRTIDTLRDLVDSGAAAKHPIYLQLDIFDPHQPFSIPAGFEQREQELRRVITLPRSYEAVRDRNFRRADNEPEIIDIYRRYWGIYDPQTLLDYRVAYILQMELVDRAIGMVLDEIRKLGLYDESLIAFISDHGEMNGRRAIVDKGVYIYPDVLRVPFVIKPAGGARPRVVDEPVSLLDLSQTLFDVAGIQPEAKFDGISLLPALSGNALPQRSPLLFFGGWHVGVNFACGIGHRSSDGSYFVYAYNLSSANDELYDMNAEDAVNLIDDPAHQSVRGDMIRRLGDVLQSDPRWSGYWAEFRIARYESLPKATGDMQLFAKPS
ncbi:MAG: sulfatase-like hydrolase/transferase [Acidobacteriota bacterium]